ncbi:MAG: hypothetical protein ABII88_04130 [Candidatus Omnitrophota bacterium]
MRVNIFVGLVVLGLGLYWLIPWIRKLNDKYIKGEFIVKKYPLKEIWSQIIGNKEVLKRLLITVTILILIRMAYHIPLPCIDTTPMRDFFSKHSTMSSSYPQIYVLNLGLLPFTGMCGLLLLFSIIIPPLRRNVFGGEKGRNKLIKHTLFGAAILAIFQSYSFMSYVFEQNLVTINGPYINFIIISITTLLAGVFCLIVAAETINRFGIGNGYALIISEAILLGIISKLYKLQSLLPILMVLGILFVLGYFTRLIKPEEIINKKGEKTTLKFRLSWVGLGPLLLASTIIMPLYTLTHFWNARWISHYYIFDILTALLIIPTTFLYSSIVFDPQYVSKLLNKYGYSFANNPKELTPSRYLEKTVLKVLPITAVLLCLGYMLPKLLVHTKLYSGSTMVVVIGGRLGLWGLTGAFLDLLDQLEFFHKKKLAGIKEWGICYVAQDEIEASIKSGYLRSQEIKALVKPYRYTWGLPIRTMVDKYEIYVPQERVQKARELIV